MPVDSRESHRDDLYSKKKAKVPDFEFDEKVVSVFSDMIQRSIPGYETIVHLSGILASEYLTEGSRCYDLGCSIGATTASILRAVGDLPVTIVGVDSSAPMIQTAQATIKDGRVEFELADICGFPLETAQVVVMNFVLQFIDPAERLDLLKRIRNSMQPNGLLVLSEKVQSTEEWENAHTLFKKSNQYSELEIAQKRQALENVMKIDNIDVHGDRLLAAGFKQPRCWFQCLNWASLIANS